ncbi:MAG: hypothetical protein AVDCRST_MAG53-3363 [uncultured Solirubrobacteraceae bacterium]|uniref:Uncharacterized protein n=1 Tax=uncultured Solirubrobacteraceae bacterium TaxID=1162706 RepID=A0A6J4TF58_9ACTN|nr:MAG: hypothetical protein AVDCRST_MAG53-3363 [uncultured Solirubrobacteraceae bacterium]
MGSSTRRTSARVDPLGRRPRSALEAAQRVEHLDVKSVGGGKLVAAHAALHGPRSLRLEQHLDERRGVEDDHPGGGRDAA